MGKKYITRRVRDVGVWLRQVRAQSCSIALTLLVICRLKKENYSRMYMRQSHDFVRTCKIMYFRRSTRLTLRHTLAALTFYVKKSLGGLTVGSKTTTVTPRRTRRKKYITRRVRDDDVRMTYS